MKNRLLLDLLHPLDTFARRHIGPDAAEVAEMLDVLGVDSLDTLIDATVPAAIRLKTPTQPAGCAWRG